MEFDTEDIEYGILDYMPSSIFILDMDWTILSVNEFQKSMFGLSDDVIGNNIFDIGLTFLKMKNEPFLPDEYPLPRSNTGIDCVSAFEHKVRLSSNKIIDISLNSSLYTDSDGETLVLISYTDITHHQEIEKKLHENTLRLENVIRNEPLVLFELDKAGNFTLSDGKALETLGLKPGEVVGQSVFDIYKDFPNMLEEIKKGLSGEIVSFVADVYGKIFNTILTPIYNNDGSFVNVLGVSIEETERKKTEDDLKASQEILLNVVQNAPIILVSTDAKGTITFAEGYGLKKLGLDPSELKDSNVYQLYGGNSDNISLIDRALKGEAFSAKIPFGEYVFILSCTPILDEKGKVAGTTSVSFDVTDREKIEKKLVESNRKLAEAQHIAHIGNWSWDLKENELTGSREALRLFGVPDYKDVVAYNNFLKLIHPDDKDMAVAAVGEAIQKAVDYNLEHRIQTPEVRDRTVLTHGRFVVDDNGKPEKIIGTIQDVTNMRNAERALRTKDKEIRKAYSDVFRAVTGDKLIITTSEEIDSALGEQIGKTFHLSEFADLSKARDQIAEIIRSNFTDIEDPYDILVSAGEIMTNAIKHADGCEIAVFKKDSYLQLKVSDSGPGIDFSILPNATLVPGFSTEQSLGLGFSIILELCDRVMLTTQPGHTSVVLEIAEDGPDNEIAA